jgi:PAS domain S-box-containing protein
MTSGDDKAIPAHTQSAQNQMGEYSGPSEFRLLKSWYLAVLRKHSMNVPAHLTPAALINADRVHIERLVLSGAHAIVRAGRFSPPPMKSLILGLGSVSLIAILASAILVFAGGALNTFSAMALLLAIVAFGSCAAAIFLTGQRVLPILDALGKEVASCSTENLADYSALPAKVTELIRTRDEYRGGENLIVDASPALLFCFDPDMRILAANRGVHRLLKYLPEELIGSQLINLVLPEDKEKLVQGMAKARQGEPVSNLQLRALSKHMHAVDLDFSIDWSGSNGLFFAKGEDITYEKTIERSRLEHISTIGHDIKIPLSSVWIALETITEYQSEGLTEQQKTTIMKAETNVERLIGLIDELLEYERSAKSGRLALSYGTAVVAEIVSDAMHSIDAQAQAKNITIETDCDDFTVWADEDKLLRVLINFLSNAIKYSPDQTTVTVTAKKTGDSLRMSVRDRGPGIPDEYKQIVFERYERLPSTQAIEGKGLGLSICKTIVESHGGLIGIDSPAGGGAEFWLVIPLGANPELA